VAAGVFKTGDCEQGTLSDSVRCNNGCGGIKEGGSLFALGSTKVLLGGNGEGVIDLNITGEVVNAGADDS
jgi:hypothetical protein